MKKDLTLLILAGGMGSRFGGLKQVEPFGPNGEFIIDYSVYDAIQAGFNKIVFLIKEENYELFRETIGSRIDGKINVEYAFQKLDDIPSGYTLPSERTKPLGTSQAVYATRNIIKEPFTMINADDFYGRDAFMKAAKYLRNINNDSTEYAMIGYLVKNTLTENGSVKRGVCKEENNFLSEIIESSVEEVNNKIMAYPLDESAEFEVEPTQTVSMNMFCLTPTVFKYIGDNFPKFLDQNKNNLEKCEYLIPTSLQEAMDDKYATVKVIPTEAKWYGVTYKEDTPYVKEAIQALVKDGEYPNHLWEENK